MSPIIPRGKVKSRTLSFAFEKDMLSRIDRAAKETGNTRTDTIRHLIRFALNAYDERPESVAQNKSAS